MTAICDGHVLIYALVSFLLVMVLFLLLGSIAHIYILNRLALRISYIEGTLDIISDSQENTMKLIAEIVDK